jgi:hypothetical protein
MLAPRMRLGEPALFLGDTEIGALEQLRRQDDLGALGGGLADEIDGLLDVGLQIHPVGGLDRGDLDLAGHQAGSCWEMQWKDPPPVRMAVDGRGMIS